MILSRYYEKIINYGLLLVLAMISFLGWQTRYSYGWGILVILALVLLLVSFFGQQKNNKFPLSLAILGLTLIFTGVLAADKYLVLTTLLPYLAAGIIFYLSYNYFNSEKSLHWLMAINGLVLGGYSLWVFYWQKDWRLGLGSNFGWKNVLANFLLVILFPILANFLEDCSKFKKIVFGLSAGLVIACLVATFSKAAWIIAAVTFGVMVFFWQEKKLKKFVNVLVVLLLGAVFLMGINLAQKQIGGSQNLASIKTVTESSISFLYRLDYWKGALQIFIHNPILGIGLGNFTQAYPKYQSSLWTGTTDPHNILVNILVSGGLVAGLAFIYFLWELLKSGLLIKKSNDLIMIGYWLGLMAALLHSLFDLGWAMPGILVFNFFILGYVVKKSDLEFMAWTWQVKKIKILVVILIPLIIVLILGVIYTENLHDQYSLDPKLPEPEKQVANYLQLTKFMPLRAEYFKELATGYFRQELVKREKGDYSEFFKSATRALSLSPNNATLNLWYGQYLSFLEKQAKNKNNRPREYLARAVDLNKYNLQNYYSLADYLNDQNQVLDALQVIQQGLEKYDPQAMDKTVYTAELRRADENLIKRLQELKNKIQAKIK